YPNFSKKYISGEERYNQGTCFLDEQQTFSDWRGEKCFLTHGHEVKVLLWGDSYAAHYVPGIVDMSAAASADVLQYTASACPPIFGFYTGGRPNCEDFNENLPNIIPPYGISVA